MSEVQAQREEAATDVLAVGELRVDMVANKRGSLAESATFTRTPGGAAAAVAAGVARLGRRAAFAGLVGDDPFGRYLARTLASYGVDTAQLRFDPRVRTPVAFAARDSSGEEEDEDLDPPAGRTDDDQFIFYREGGADQLLAPSVALLEAVATSRMLVCGGVALSNPLPRAAVHAAARHALQRGVAVVFDVNWRPRLWQHPRRARDLYREMLPHVDVLKLRVSELIMLTRGAASTEVRRQEALLQAWIELLVAGRDRPLLVALTRGEAGCSFALWKPAAGLYLGRLGAREIEVRDPAGAGDAFLAALLVALLDLLAPLPARHGAQTPSLSGAGRQPAAEPPGAAPAQSDDAVGRIAANPRLDLARLVREDLHEVFAWANTAGALATAHRGTMSSLPNRATVLRMIRALDHG